LEGTRGVVGERTSLRWACSVNAATSGGSILVGEVRGEEAFDLLQALNTGHAGSLSTIHSNSADQALVRLATCVAESRVEWPYHAVRYQIAAARSGTWSALEFLSGSRCR
jgi:pilus assembly protein CpaF